MTRVMQVLYSGLGGHGSVAFSLLDAGESENVWAGQLIFFGIEPIVGEYERACIARSIEPTYVPTVAGQAWRAWPLLYRALAMARPDAIILHSVKTILPCALYAARHGIPLVAVEHQPNALKHRGEWWASRLLMRLADAVVVLTGDYSQQLRARLGRAWNGAKVHLIPNGIDTGKFAPSGAIRVSQRRVVGMAGRLSRTKCQHVLIESIALLVARDGPERWRLSLAGDGETLPVLRELVRSLGLEDVVAFTGYLDAACLRDWFKSIDFYAHASAGETLSTSILQAMAMGLPVVGSDVQGISNLLSSGGGVGLLSAQTPESMAMSLRRLANEPELADGLRRRARDLAVSEFSQTKMFDRYRSLLDQLCTE